MNKIYKNKKVINLIDNKDNLNYALDNEMLVVNLFNKNSQSINIDFSQSDDSYLVINYSMLTNENVDINIKGNITGNNNKCVINVRCLSICNHANINVNVKANEKTIGNEIIEDLKGINEDGTVCFMPILEVDTHEVDAQHFATIGNFDKNELFYLESLGLSEKTSKELLKKSFIYNLFNEEFLNLIEDRKE
jgi:hypothetical protein